MNTPIPTQRRHKTVVWHNKLAFPAYEHKKFIRPGCPVVPCYFPGMLHYPGHVTSSALTNGILDALMAALRDEITAAKTLRGDTTTAMSDGHRTMQGSDSSMYTFLVDRSLMASDDTPVEVEVRGRRYPGSVISLIGDEITVNIESPEDLGDVVPHAGLITNLWFLPNRLLERFQYVRDGDEVANLDLADLVFTPATTPMAPSTLPPLPSLSSDGASLNPSQLKAIQTAVALPVSFVWGPPGTGKTATLAGIAETFAQRDLRVLVVAHSNAAVDEATMDIAAALQHTPFYENYQILRLGHFRAPELDRYDRVLFTRITAALQARFGSDRVTLLANQKLYLERARIVCTTLTQTFLSGLFPAAPFDVCCVDEASMASMPALYWALSRARSHAVLAGDFLQLPPVALAETAAAKSWLGRSIYQHLQIDTPKRARHDPRVALLDVQYRMHPQIAYLPNTLFYDGLLTTPPEVAARPGPQPPLTLVDTAQGGGWSMRVNGGSRFNIHSALTAVLLAQRLVGMPPQPRQVAIVTPYTAQARLVGSLLRDLKLERAVRTATVHRIQGGEVPTLIFDSVEAPGERPAPMVDDTREPAARLLLNVALTRAQQRLIMLAHPAHLRHSLRPEASLVRAVAAFARATTPVPSPTLTAPETARPLETDLADAMASVLVVVRDGRHAGRLPALLARVRPRVAVSAIVPPGGKIEHQGLVVRRMPGISDAASVVVIDGRIIWEGAGLFNGGMARRLEAPRAAALLEHSLARTTGVASPSSNAVTIQTREACPTCGALLVATFESKDVLLTCGRAPDCEFSRPLRKHARVTTERACPACGRPMILRLGNFGPFLGCSGYGQHVCKRTINLGRSRVAS